MNTMTPKNPWGVMHPPASELPLIGLALSGGGARGLAHVGVLEVFEQEGIPIHAVAGCSMGAYTGSLWAAGLPASTLIERAQEIPDRRALRRLLDFDYPFTRGLLKGDRLRKHLERDLGDLTFADLPTALLVVATDLDALDCHVFHEGPVAPAVHASAAIPGVCVPVTLKGHRYTDGGATAPLPVTPLRQCLRVDRVIAVNVMPPPEDFAAQRDTSFANRGPRWLQPLNLMAEGRVLDTFSRALMSAQLKIISQEAARADVLIQPRFESSCWHDFENHAAYIEAGRQAARRALPELLELTRPLHPPARGENRDNRKHHETQVQRSRVGHHAA
ncbi:MAG: patatin-like phospholipase family protein [Verrucomicrobiales bacterium]|nr:patatin-like phospholipase family protein [Verrucomicrobiales bacterium]